MEGLFPILKRKYAQKSAHFWEQKFLFLLLHIKKYVQVPWTYQKVSFLYSEEPLCNKIFRQKAAQIRRGQNMHQIFLGALDHEIVNSLYEV